jgi:hypothetical protein
MKCLIGNWNLSSKMILNFFTQSVMRDHLESMTLILKEDGVF